MKRISVLMFGWELAPAISGGLGVVCRELTEELTKKNIDVTFVIPRLPVSVQFKNFELIDANTYRSENKNLLKIQIESLLTPYSEDLEYSRINSDKDIHLNDLFDCEIYGHNLFTEIHRFALIAKEIAKSSRWDIIHVHDWMTSLAGFEAKKILNIPLILHIHSTEYDRSAGNPNPEILIYEEDALKKADRIITISEYTKNIIIEKYHIDQNKISVVYNAINQISNPFSEEKNSKNEKIVLFLARLSVQKGADYLLKAAQKVLQIKKNIKFVIVGKGPMLKSLVELAFNLGINENVIFTGALSHDQVDRAYKHADLFIMPSVSEPFGLTCLEAIKNGTPVIISKQSGVSEVVSNCLKVDFWDIDLMASKIISILNHENLSDTLIENGYRDLDHLTWDKQADRVIKIYKELIN